MLSRKNLRNYNFIRRRTRYKLQTAYRQAIRETDNKSRNTYFRITKKYEPIVVIYGEN